MLRLRPRHGSFVLAASLLMGAAASARAAARYNHTMTLTADGNVLIVGGKGAADTSVATVEIYITTGAKYESRANLNTERSSHTATLLPDGRVLVTGGVNVAGAILDTGELFDPRLNTWTTVPNTNFGGPRVNHTATLLPNGKVLIAGGQTNAAGNVNGDGTPGTTTCSLYSGGAFTACGAGLAMQMPRAAHTATLLSNGRVFVAGGYRGPGLGYAATTEIYDPVTDVWTAGPAMSQARAWHTATQMGNQRVLITGGFNGLNLRESFGYLGTSEIYDPNGDTLTPGPSMSARKAYHTSQLKGVGNVALYGGLGNITTSYVDGTFPLRVGTLAVTPTGENTGNIQNYPATKINFNLDKDLSAAVSGRIVDGDLNISNGRIVAPTWTAALSYPDRTYSTLDGRSVSRGRITTPVTVTNLGLSGTITFPAQNVSSTDMDPITAGQVTTAGPIAPNVSTTLTGGTMTGQIHVPVDKTYLNGTVLRGHALISNASIVKPSGNFPGGDGWEVTLTSGIADITGGVVALDNKNIPSITMNVTFTSLAGTIKNSSSTNEASPFSLVGQKATGLTVTLTYVISPINLSTDLSLVMDVSTIAVRLMQFSDNESYTPNTNKFSLGTANYPTFNHSELVLPNSDEFIYGGRSCTDETSCAAFTYSAINGYGAYILLHEEGNPWTTVGSLGAPRANHTLTVLPDGRVLAAGGEDASNTVGVTELYQPVERTWLQAADMKQRRSHHTATLLPNGNVLAAGGFTALNHSTGTSRHAEIFYPETATWVETASMLSSRAYHAAVLLPDGNPFVIAGFANGAYLSSTEVFISTAHKWLAGPSLTETRAQFTATLLQDGRILVVGGVNAVNGVLGTTRLFNPATWSWSPGASMIFARHSHTANMLRDGRVLVAAGSDGNRELAQAEIYDPASNTWQLVRAGPLFGNDLGHPRLGHTATTLPDGKILFVGGFNSLGGPIDLTEGFDVDFSTFQNQGLTGLARGDHATVLLRDGFVLTAGGFDGLSYSGKTEILYGGAFPDVVTLAGGQRRRPLITQLRPAQAPIPVGTPITVVGTNFKGMTEASGGGGGSANGHHAHPRVYLQRADSASSSANDSGWMIDLTSGMFHSGLNSWANMDSSLTFNAPATTATLPLGWYHLRVASNDQFSESQTFQVGPPKPSGSPGIPVAAASGSSAVFWTWASASGGFDGYSVYSATNGVFLSTVAPSGGPTASFLQTGLGPDTSALIKVAAYSITGDGAVAFATVPVLTAVSIINDLKGIGQDPQTLFWSWNPVEGAIGYNVYSASTGVRQATTTLAAYTETALSTNTGYGIFTQAVMPGGLGLLSAAATAYTLAAVPTPGFPPMRLVSTGSVVAQWLTNTNPANTLYHAKVFVAGSTDPVHFSSITQPGTGFSDLTPNTAFAVSVAAFNGDGVYTPFVSLGSTYTFARPPTNLRVTKADPSGISVEWSPNSNPGYTTYQVLYSSDGFTNDISTFIAFSAAYTTASASISNLLTGTTYTVRITARNAFGQETSAGSISAFTDNGGGPNGSLTLIARTTAYATLSGTLGGLPTRRFEMRIPPGTFDVDTTIFIASRAAADLHPTGTGCGAAVAGFSITNLPAVQPRLPLEVGLTYITGEANPLSTFGIVRYDPVSGACVPMESRVDTANNIIYARVNHFSDFQLQQLTPSAAVATARVFPNPLYTSSQGFFTFDNLPANSHVRVFTLHGEEVFDQSANASGIVTWRAQNKVGRPVASGIYLAVIESGGEKKILKLVVVR